MDVLSRKKLVIVVLYGLVGTGWILGSDWLLFHLFGDIETTFLGSTLKGLLFVGLMSLLLYFLLYRLERSEKRAEQAEVASELNLLTLPEFFAAAPVIVYVLEQRDRGSHATWVSPNIVDVLQYSTEEALLPGWWEKHLHPDDREEAIKSSQRICFFLLISIVSSFFFWKKCFAFNFLFSLKKTLLIVLLQVNSMKTKATMRQISCA